MLIKELGRDAQPVTVEPSCFSITNSVFPKVALICPSPRISFVFSVPSTKSTLPIPPVERSFMVTFVMVPMSGIFCSSCLLVSFVFQR